MCLVKYREEEKGSNLMTSIMLLKKRESELKFERMDQSLDFDDACEARIGINDLLYY